MKENQDKIYIELYHSENKESKDRAVIYFLEKYENFIKSEIKEFCSTFKDKYFEDLLSSGKLGMIEALEKYDPNKGKFTTYSKKYILGQLNVFLCEIVFQCTTYYAGLQNKLRKTIVNLKNEGIECTAENISKQSGMSLQIVKRELQMQNIRIVSLDEINNR